MFPECLFLFVTELLYGSMVVLNHQLRLCLVIGHHDSVLPVMRLGDNETHVTISMPLFFIDAYPRFRLNISAILP